MTPQERLKKIDRFNRERAIERGEDYQGSEDHIDFVIYKTKKADGMIELRCDNLHLAGQQGDRYISNVSHLDPRELESAAFKLEEMEKERLLLQCRHAWVEEVQKFQQQLAQSRAEKEADLATIKHYEASLGTALEFLKRVVDTAEYYGLEGINFIPEIAQFLHDYPYQRKDADDGK